MSDYINPLLTFLASIVAGVLAAIPSIKALRAQQAERDAHAKDIEDQITERVLLRANKEIQILSEKLTSSREDCNSKVEELRKEYDKKLSDLERDYDAQIAELKNENILLRTENTSLRIEINRLKTKLGCKE
jgi:hypothetical protein